MMAVTPLTAAISAHRAAWDAFQVAPGGDDSDESMNACCELADALDALVLAACAFPVLSGPLPSGASALLAHLRWWLAEEVDFADGYQPAYGILQGRAADLTVALERHATRDASRDEPDPIFAAIEANDMATAAVSAAIVHRDEDDDASEAVIDAGYRAVDAAFADVRRTMPTTPAGLYALARFYERDQKIYDRCSSGGDYFEHLAAAIRGCDSKGGFSGVGYRFPAFPQALGILIPQQVFGGAR